MNEKKDKVYSSKKTEVIPFKFDNSIAQVFADMAKRSIPGYESVMHQTAVFAKKYVKKNSNIYDLGCSLGQATLAVRHAVDISGCTIYAIDSSKEMVERLNKIVMRDIGVVPVNVRCADIREVSLTNSSFIMLNYTLQFIDFKDKNNILQKIFEALNPGGSLIFSEKIIFSDLFKQHYIEDCYFEFKRFNGYNELEISQKRDALETVLKLQTADEHIDKLKKLGFSSIEQWFSYLNFASFIAIK